jgi:hypothetical protein
LSHFSAVFKLNSVHVFFEFFRDNKTQEFAVSVKLRLQGAYRVPMFDNNVSSATDFLKMDEK